MAVTPRNIQSGFAVSGIWSFNRDIFTDDDFQPSEVTNRPCPAVIRLEPSLMDATASNEDVAATVSNEDPTPSTANYPPMHTASNEDLNRLASNKDPTPSTSKMVPHLTSEQLHPYPKAKERKNLLIRKKRRTAILTDTPEKEELEREQRERDEKKRVKAESVTRKLKMKVAKKQCKQKSGKPSRARKYNSSSSDENCLSIVCLKPFSESFSGQEWIQCIICKKWAHTNCTYNEDNYICINCQSGTESYPEQ